jgi:hypothetical protein
MEISPIQGVQRDAPRGSGEGGWVVRLVFCRPSLGKVGGGQIEP